MADTEMVAENKDKKEFGKFDRWEIEQGARTIIEAERIKLDKEKMKYILPLLEKEKEAVANVTSVADVLYGKKESKK